MEGDHFVFVCGHVEELIGNHSVGIDLYARGEDVVGWDGEPADTFFDDPIVRGADGPDVASPLLEIGDQDGELGEDVGLDVLGEELRGGASEGFDREAGVDPGHVAADVVLGDRLIFVAFVPLENPVDLLGGDELGVDGPVHEGGAGVAGPEGAVAVEDSDLGIKRVNAGVEVGSREAYGRSNGLRQAELLAAPVGYRCERTLDNRILVNRAGRLGLMRGDGLGGERRDADADQEAGGGAEQGIAQDIVIGGYGLGQDERQKGQGWQKTVEPDWLYEAVGGMFTTDKVGHVSIITRRMQPLQKGWILFLGRGKERG